VVQDNQVLERHPSSIAKTILATRIMLQNRCATTSTSSLPSMMRFRSIGRSNASNSRIHTSRAGATRSPTAVLIFLFLSELAQPSPLIVGARGGNADVFATGANGYRETLDCAGAGLLARNHAVVDGKVAADHVGTSGGCVASKCFGCVVLAVGAVFAVVDADYTSVTMATD
jgi:hypothetical protein